MLGRLRNLFVAAPPTVEQRSVLLAGQPVGYTLKRSAKRRSIGLRIDHRGLTVSMPLSAPERWLHEVLQDKAEWVIAKLEDRLARQPVQPLWEEGAAIPFMGEQLRLSVSQGRGRPLRQGDALNVAIAGEVTPARIEQQVLRWYRQQALALFAGRVAHYAPLMQVAPRDIKLSAAKKQWGCCTARGTIRLNWQLIKLPLALTDYVVVHELAHLREMNHSAAFWQVVAQSCPDYQRLRRELKTIAL